VFDPLGPPPLSTPVKGLLVLWCVVLVPWIPVALIGTGMAFEGGHTLGAYLFIATAWTYPVLVSLVYFLRRRNPELIWLPLLTLVPLLFASFIK